MNLLIEGRFSEPPSSIHVFRDVTLYSKCILNYDILLECDKESIDIYWSWLKKYYAWDFVDDIIEPKKEYGISIRKKGGSICLKKLDEYSLHHTLNKLSIFNQSS